MMRFRLIQCSAWLPLLCWLCSGQELFGAARRAAGREIYRQLCAKCHGPGGAGVHGKYDTALQGDWTLEKLTRYIDKNMPDDAPGKCVGPDAETVARYIYDAFYSREARLRNHPPRIELVRLTNRQYANTVADLLKHFSSSDVTATEERGLRASYYGAKGFARESKAIERVDRQVDFDFGEKFPDPIPVGTNGFSIQWRGSIFTDETGDYEFILKTPNGARLWLNDDEQTLIDAWVASGEKSEHNATIRLLGGRTYPLKLDYFKFKDKQASISLQWKPPQGVREPVPARNLSPARAKSIFVTTTPFPPDDSSVGYERGVSVSKAWDEAATQAAIEAANEVVKSLDRFSGSKPVSSAKKQKTMRFRKRAMRRFFRCAKFISLRVLASANSPAARFCNDLATSAMVFASFSVTCAVVRCGLRNSGSANSARSRRKFSGVPMVAFVNSCVS